MDLIVETKNFKYYYQRVPMSYIHLFLCKNMKKTVEAFVKYQLTKKEVRKMISFLKEQVFDTEMSKEKVIDELTKMEMLMEGKEKASFYFW